MIEEPAGTHAQLIFLRMHLRALLVGMKNSRLSQTEILAKVQVQLKREAPFKNSKRGVSDAIAEINKKLEELNK